MAQPASTPTSNPLFPNLELPTAPLDDSETCKKVVELEKELVAKVNKIFDSQDVLEDIGDRLILPAELFLSSRKLTKPKVNPLERLKELQTEEVEDEEETEDDEEEDEEAVEDEEDDAGGDYLVSHFDNGENYEDNDEEGDDMTL